MRSTIDKIGIVVYRGSNDPIGFQGVLVLLVTIFLYRFAYIAGKIIISTTYTIPKTMKEAFQTTK